MKNLKQKISLHCHLECPIQKSMNDIKININTVYRYYMIFKATFTKLEVCTIYILFCADAAP
jgi:hypothetical protein